MPKFVPRERKHKAIARRKAGSGSNNHGAVDANSAEILPAEEQVRALKKAALKAELVRESQGKISGKKKKRLDKYIDTKIKKEENLALLKKLATQKVDTSLFQSSKKLGSGSNTKKETLRRALAESRAGIDIEKNEGLLFEKREIREFEFDSDDENAPSSAQPPAPARVSSKQDGDGDGDGDGDDDEDSRNPTPKAPAPPPQQNVGLYGSGLKRPLEMDVSGKPVIQVRKRRKGQNKPVVIEQEVAWEGFSSGEESMNSDEEGDSEASSADNSGDDSGEEAISGSESGESDGSEEDWDNDSEDSDTSPEEDTRLAKKERTSAFTAWATQQRNVAVGFTPSNNLSHALLPKPANFQPRAPEQDPLPPELETNTATDATRKAFSVHVERSPEVQEARLQLPVVAEEQKIMEAVHNNDVVVVWGATGSGKTTQVPQFLFESGYGAAGGPTPGMIGVTQPRRVAAVSMSKRVGDELGDQSAKVAYQIRFDTSTSAKTAIKFMTDGVLLREITQDFLLAKYSAIIIDEAHERSVNTDILIGMLSRIVDLRAQMAKDDPQHKPLKLIIMSATLRISDFTENKRLFRNEAPPLIKAEGRQYTVANHFARRTQRDYVEEMYRKVCKGHRKLPKGGMLVFLTGQNEISQLAKRLKQEFSSTQGQEVKTGKVMISPTETPLETEDIELGAQREEKDYHDEDGSDSEDSVIMDLDDEDDKEFEIEEEKPEETVMNVHVLPLYSQLPTNQQLRVFVPPPDGSRLIVLATNVAETSLTIPGVRYVFDCGRAKEKKYDLVTGVQSFEVGWISKASANQRSGRAGRTGPGHCYRLYSSAVFERDFEEYAAPEILRTPLEGVVLQLKSMGAPVVNFPFPTPPNRESLQKAENLLLYLGALSPDGRVTKLGQELSLYPLNPRFARMVAMGVAQGLTAETIALVAALSVPELIIPENKLGLREPTRDVDVIRTEQDNIEAEERSRLRKAYNAAQAKLSLNSKQSDCIKLSSAICAYAYEPKPQNFCEDMFLNAKAMNEASQLRHQLTNIVRAHRPTAIGTYQAKLPAPSERNINLLTQICAAGHIDQIAIRADLSPVPPELPRKPKTAIDVPYVTLFSSQAERSEDPNAKYVYLHPSSLLARTPPAKMPGYIIYSHLQRAAIQTINGSRTPKTRMHPLTSVTRPQIINIALNTPLLQASKPKGKIVDLARQQGGPERRECEVELSLMGEKGSQGWGLGIRRVVQRKEAGGRYVIEKILE
ncbi:P-loop containing nucleoside triphosphate hydrolase protein [Clathrospora elynae]|uniref:RNA helicase n=1 Tax=Clathrospora elynae TaxID=706981 RepID=A0A6A5S5C8_9PLEO|nr:P-loop containing nucleoside triphosphate hydrolase protein [Clathrospora elynae]